MNNFVIRTEELEDSQLKELYVETENDNDILNRLKSQSPVLLVGSRGMGKSFLFKISQMQLLENFQKDRIFRFFLLLEVHRWYKRETIFNLNYGC